jgi:hypothetical protein
VGVQCRCADGVWRLYERLAEDWRRYDAMLWQLPFGTMTAVGVILTLAFHYIPSSEHVVRAILFTALAWFTLTMMHLSYKVRHFQIERSACIEAIECECLMRFAVPYNTEGAEKYAFRKEKRFERWFYERRSYHLAYIMYIGIIYMLITFTLKELFLIHLWYAMLYALPATVALILIGLCIAWLFERN